MVVVARKSRTECEPLFFEGHICVAAGPLWGFHGKCATTHVCCFRTSLPALAATRPQEPLVAECEPARYVQHLLASSGVVLGELRLDCTGCSGLQTLISYKDAGP